MQGHQKSKAVQSLGRAGSGARHRAFCSLTRAGRTTSSLPRLHITGWDPVLLGSLEEPYGGLCLWLCVGRSQRRGDTRPLQVN